MKVNSFEKLDAWVLAKELTNSNLYWAKLKL